MSDLQHRVEEPGEPWFDLHQRAPVPGATRGTLRRAGADLPVAWVELHRRVPAPVAAMGRAAAAGAGAEDAVGERSLGDAAEGFVSGHGIGASVDGTTIAELEDSTKPHQPPLLAAVSAVLGDDDLLREILLRLGFPNCLVRASLVSKRWYLCASDPAFLRRFRELHPPRVLGFYVELWSQYHRQRRTRFVLRPPPKELDALIRRRILSLDLGIFEDLDECWNGSILTSSYNSPTCGFEYTVRWPLDHARGTMRLPEPPDSSEYSYAQDIFPGGADTVVLLFGNWIERAAICCRCVQVIRRWCLGH